MTQQRWYGLDDVLTGHAGVRPDEAALVCGPHRLSWRELDQRVDRLASVLNARGLGPGDRLLWLGQNCHRMLEALFAAARLGAVACPVNWRQSVDELRFVLSDAAPTVVLWQRQEIGDTATAARQATATSDPATPDTSAPVTATAGTADWIGHDDDGPDGYEALLAAAPEPGPATPRPGIDPDEPVLMLYTGAFDGRPNGALLSGTALLAQTTTLRLLEGTGADEVFLNSGPLFHIGTLRRTLAVAHAGGRNVLVRRVEPEPVCRLIEDERCTSAFLMRPTMEQLVAANADGRYDLSSLRTPPGPPGWDDMVDVQRGPRVRSGYGQTELAGVVTFGLPERPGIGAWPGPLAQVEVLDPAGSAVPAGEVGEIAVRGPMVANGYHRRPELTTARTRFGWWHTGDLGRREADGSISFVGPLLRMIKSAAENVYPAEVEGALRRHPGVAAAAVLGVPDPSWGQRVLAVLVRAPGSAVTAGELDEHCRRELAGYKRPRRWEFVDELPVLGGTTDHAALDARFGGGGYPGTT